MEQEFNNNYEEDTTEELFLDDGQVEHSVENVFGNSNSSFLYEQNDEPNNLTESSVGEFYNNEFSITDAQSESVQPENNLSGEINDEIVSQSIVENEAQKNMDVSKDKQDNVAQGESAKGNLTFMLIFGVLLLVIIFLLPYISGYK